jgi:SAM-dependent methyltransferase
MHDELLREQLAYYSARAREYDASLEPLTPTGGTTERPEGQEWMAAVHSLRAVGPRQQVLELAAGTGIWTKELLTIARELTVLDGSPEMLAMNRAKIHDPRVRYECVDLFDWQPTTEYDLVFFAFWLSHVPPDLLAPFLDNACRAVRPGGRLFIVDEPAGGQQLSGPSEEGMFQTRVLQDGRSFNIVKVYHDPARVQEQLLKRGLAPLELATGKYFFHLLSGRSREDSARGNS